ncbi:ComE operon protein 1 [Staphylococcus microti]|uniref:ComE operon protein 1 n=1 Tax=Staphylococcus microti TaxID=569857 RepID=A0A380GV29_9STAP|nr:helix-hairpin-helix domain-containing protein [Staphylococcus microti]PNZ82676.1 competence protein ComEA [Staphylococcus microti]SUM57495.1 ComE operon protein 1 [Staphylococcus microti]
MSIFTQIQAWCLKNRALAIMGVLLAITIIVLLLNFHSQQREVTPSEPLIQEAVTNNASADTKLSHQSSPQTQQPTAIVVDIKGAVKHPNTYQMMSDDRMKQLLDKAEALPTADLSQINLAEKLSDQKMIYIPQKGEQTKNSGATTSNTTNGAQGQPINLNTAQLSDLTTIPGIGPAKAQAILAYREEKGQFQSVEELKEVKGIGDKTFENLSSYFTV